MALKEWASIVGDANLSVSDKERLLLIFHAKNNHRIHTHLLAHGSLLGCAIKDRNAEKTLRQAWLTAAVIPVHSRALAIRFIRGAVRNLA